MWSLVSRSEAECSTVVDMHLSWLRTSLKPALTLVVMFFLLMSFGLHSAQIPHAHPGEQAAHQAGAHGETEKNASTLSYFAESAHATEKKLFLVVVSVWVFALAAGSLWPVGWSRFLSIHEGRYRLRWQIQKRYRLFFHTYIEWFLARGILNPKLF